MALHEGWRCITADDLRTSRDRVGRAWDRWVCADDLKPNLTRFIATPFDLGPKRQPRGLDTTRNEEIDHGLGSRARYTLFFLPGASTHHGHLAQLRIAHNRCRNGLYGWDPERIHFDCTRAEVDAIEDQNAFVDGQHTTPIWASIFVLLAVVDLGFHRTRVAGVVKAIVVIVGVRTSVFVFDTIDILRRTRTCIARIDDATLIATQVSAAILILKTIDASGPSAHVATGISTGGVKAVPQPRTRVCTRARWMGCVRGMG